MKHFVIFKVSTPVKLTTQSGLNSRNRLHNGGLFVNFREILYLLSNKKNINDQERGLILTENFIEKSVIDKIVSLK